ncbi:MAG: phosphoglycerate mutase family protein, partial [Chloroflexi bacterium]|nr:phosphoglycerate mutase family protein [Chloroflexota bacterium]
LVGERLAVPVDVLDGLHEHDRTNVGFLSDAEFDAAVAAFFDRPDELVLGRETANEALARFSRAVQGALARWPAGNLVIVAHGTVISLYVAAVAGLDARALWKRLGLPSFVVLALPEGKVTAEVDSLTK